MLSALVSNSKEEAGITFLHNVRKKEYDFQLKSQKKYCAIIAVFYHSFPCTASLMIKAKNAKKGS
jgi:hypothetical protein